MYKKIDIYLRKFGTNFWQYECSTNFYKTCKEAKQSFCKRHGLDETQVKCNFSIKGVQS